LDIDKELPHRVGEGIWPCKLYQINAEPKGNWCWGHKRRLVSRLCVGQNVRVCRTQGRQEVWKWERSWRMSLKER